MDGPIRQRRGVLRATQAALGKQVAEERKGLSGAAELLLTAIFHHRDSIYVHSITTTTLSLANDCENAEERKEMKRLHLVRLEKERRQMQEDK